MGVELVKDEAVWTLKLGGALDIFEVTSVHAAALQAVNAPGAVTVSLHDVDSVDTSITQVLLALRRTCATAGREICFEGAPPAVADTWRRLGVDAELG
jgi:anti-anti-sigma regulatory factor